MLHDDIKYGAYIFTGHQIIMIIFLNTGGLNY